MIHALQRITDRIANVISVVAGVLMVLLTTVVFLAVVSRYLFSLPIKSTGELSGLIFAWLVFVTAITVTHNEDNIAVTYFRTLLPSPLQTIVKIMTKLITLGFVVFILVSSIRLSLSVISTPLPSLRISTAWLYGSVALPFAIVTLVVLLQFVSMLVDEPAPQDEKNSVTVSENDDDLKAGGVE